MRQIDELDAAAQGADLGGAVQQGTLQWSPGALRRADDVVVVPERALTCWAAPIFAHPRTRQQAAAVPTVPVGYRLNPFVIPKRMFR